MAEVYEAEIIGPAGFAKQVCLKRIRPDLSADDGFVQMFEAEARIAARLHHNNIVSVFDFDRHDGQMFLTMEYVDGCDLNQIIQEAAQASLSLPVEFAVYVMDGLLAALDHAHTGSADGKTQPIIHRDISPHNVLISVNGTVKLTDFGIAKSRGLSDATQIGVIKGKPAYLAPEQVDGRTSPASDLFSAGLVMYETLTGKRAIRLDRNTPLAAKLAAFQYTPVPWFSDKLNGFLAILLAATPRDRFATAEAARTALKALEIAPTSEKEAAALVQSAVRLKNHRLEIEKSNAGAPRRNSSIETHFATTPPKNSSTTGSSAPQRSTDKASVQPASFRASEAANRRRFAPMFLAAAAVFAAGVGILALTQKDRSVPERSTALNAADDVRPTSTTQLGATGRADSRRNDAPKAKPAHAGGRSNISTAADDSTIEAKIVRLTAPLVPKVSPEPANPSATPSAESNQSQDKRESRAPTVIKRGALNVNVRPWAEIFVDGTSRGTTPLQALPLKAGRHVVRIENEPLGYSEEITVQIRHGKTVVLNRAIKK